MRPIRPGIAVLVLVLVAILATTLLPAAVVAQTTEPAGSMAAEPAETMAAEPAETMAAEPAETMAAEPAATASVRFLHGAPHGAIDVYVDGEPMLEDLEFGGISEYLDVAAGERLFEAVGPEMTPEDVRGTYGNGVFPNAAELTAELQPGAAYTLVANGNDAAGTAFLMLQDKPKPKAGQALVRMVGGICEACGQLDYRIAGNKKPLATNLHYPDARYASKYQKVKPGAREVSLSFFGNKNPVTTFDPVELAPGTASSLFVVGRIDNGTITLVPALDAALSDLLVLNASRDGAPLDVYVDGKRLAKKLPPGLAAKPQSVLSDDHLVQVVESGAKPEDGTLAEGLVTLAPGAQAMIVGVGQTLESVAAPTSVAATADTPQIRFVHADADTPTVDVELRDMDVIEGLSVGDTTDYLTLPEQSSYFWIRPSDGVGGPLHEAPLDLGPGNYTAYIGGSQDDATVTLVIMRDKTQKAKKKG